MPRVSLVVALNGTESTIAPLASRYPDRPGMAAISTAGVPFRVQLSDFGLSLASSHFVPTRACHVGDNGPPDRVFWPRAMWE